MNDLNVKNEINKINEKSLKIFDEIIMNSIIKLTIYNKTDKDMLRRLTLAHISFFSKSNLKSFEVLSSEEKDLYCEFILDGIKELFEENENKENIRDLTKVLYIFLDNIIANEKFVGGDVKV